MPAYMQLLLDVLAAGLELGVDDGLGQRHLDEVEELLEHGVARGGGLLEALAALETGADVLGQLGHGVELGGGLREVVVELGELLLLDGADLDLDVDVLAELASPPTSCEVKVFSSPAVMPVSASSRPSSMPPRPTW